MDLAEYRRRTEQEGQEEDEVFDGLALVQFLDYENENDHPVEDKYRVSQRRRSSTIICDYLILDFTDART